MKTEKSSHAEIKKYSSPSDFIVDQVHKMTKYQHKHPCRPPASLSRQRDGMIGEFQMTGFPMSRFVDRNMWFELFEGRNMPTSLLSRDVSLPDHNFQVRHMHNFPLRARQSFPPVRLPNAARMPPHICI